MFLFDSAEFRYDPFPIGVIRPVLPAGLYDALVDSYPPVELFKHLPDVGNKYSLSEKYHPERYHDFVKSTPPWRDLHAWVKSRDFFDTVVGFLLEHYIDLDIADGHFSGKRGRRVWPWRLSEIARGRWPRGDLSFRTRFEFSMLPADGGYVIAHTDTPRKVVTLVVSMLKDGEWDARLGGGTEIDRVRDPRYSFNWVNAKIPFEALEPIDTYEFVPNQCVIFIKTFNSLHCVRHMNATGSPVMRRTLTLNIERQE